MLVGWNMVMATIKAAVKIQRSVGWYLIIDGSPYGN